MIKVDLIAHTSELPNNLISHAAKTCYSSKVPEMGKQIDAEAYLFNTGHHTTFQHTFFTFCIDGLSVAAATFGLHLNHPFYNTDQRSGRYSKMYDKPDFDEIEAYIKKYWPQEKCIQDVMDFIKAGVEIFHDNIERGTKVVEDAIKEERPFVNDEYIEKQAKKIAQEQLRNFVSLIAPMALDFTINLSALTAMYRSAWSPEMREMTQQMVDAVVAKYPELAYAFKIEVRRDKDWAPKFNFKNIAIRKEPGVELIYADVNNINSKHNTKDSVDLGYFDPENMVNNTKTVKSKVEVSCATMGQDQRHRAIKRTAPEFTGNFYMPYVLQELGLESKVLEFFEMYKDLCSKISPTLATAIAPYGAMVSYEKSVDVNGLTHEQEKRTCWCAQEEIYYLSVLLRKEIEKKHGSDCELLSLLSPACYKTGKCIEGRRYCGRNLKDRLDSGKDYFPKRKV